MTLIQEKVKQAFQILNEFNIDLWLTFVRETSAGGDPVLSLIYGLDLTWQSALILTRTGQSIAIIGDLEAEAARRTGAYATIVPYHQAFGPKLIPVLEQLNPKTVGINYSIDDVHADGLSVGMHQMLLKLLAGTPFKDRLVSAEKVIGALRSRKTPTEIERIKSAVQTTKRIFENTFNFVRPGMTEIQISDFMHQQMLEFNVTEAWDYHNCPTVNAGPASSIGHIGPTDLKIEPGQILHIDFGVKQNDFCSDIQRVAYFLAPGEKAPQELSKKALRRSKQPSNSPWQQCDPEWQVWRSIKSPEKPSRKPVTQSTCMRPVTILEGQPMMGLVFLALYGKGTGIPPLFSLNQGMCTRWNQGFSSPIMVILVLRKML